MRLRRIPTSPATRFSSDLSLFASFSPSLFSSPLHFLSIKQRAIQLQWHGNTKLTWRHFLSICCVSPLSHRLLTFPRQRELLSSERHSTRYHFSISIPISMYLFFPLPSVCCPLNRELFSYIDKETLNGRGDTFFFWLFDASLHGYFSLLSSPASCQVHRELR